MQVHPSLATTAAAPSRTTRGLLFVFGSTFFELTAYFMLLPWLLLRLKADGTANTEAGWFAAMSWLGVLLATPFASAVTRRCGARGALTLSAAVGTFATSGFLLSDSLPMWCVLEVVGGMASGVRWIVAEAAVAELAPGRWRGRMVCLFETMVAATFVVGPGLLARGEPRSGDMGWIILSVMALSLLSSLALPRLPTAAADRPDKVPGLRRVVQTVKDHPVIMLAGFVGGFFECGLNAMLPLYGLLMGWESTAATLLMVGSGLGSATMMLPTGLLADAMVQTTRKQWLMSGAAWLAVGASLLLPLGSKVPDLMMAVVFTWGAAGGALYALAMIDIGNRERGHRLVDGTAVLVLAYTLGSMTAPALGGWLLDVGAGLGFPAMLLMVSGLAVWSLRTPTR